MGGMVLSRFLVRRIVLGVLTLLLVSVVVFAATQALPGDAARAALGQEATPERYEALRQQLNLDRPLVSQFLQWVGGIATGDLGESSSTQEPVSGLISGRLANSAFLVLVAALIALPLSVALGVLSAVRRDSMLDHGLSGVTLMLAALPEFVIGILLVLFFATSVFPVLPAVSLLPPDAVPWSDPAMLVLPAATLVLAVTPYISRIMRGAMIEILESEYIVMARLKGLPPRTIIWRHAVPNAIVPAIQVSAINLAWMAGGVVVVEFVFSFPGIGVALVDAVNHRDVTVVQALTLMIAGAYVLLNVLADTASIMLTPKLRRAGR
ncbi:MAG: peptide/nickel transport system permease protein [Solirubrobacteraceae bacterium]|nr:peptide/nickel transport system permease protein [Solirubrobacteraceae bacterium]